MSLAADSPTQTSDRAFLVVNGLVSSLALGFLFWLLMVHRGGSSVDVGFLPAVNASLNALAATCLVLGRRFIRQGNRRAHKKSMIAAFLASALFFVSYVTYHYLHGDTRFFGRGLLRAGYLLILASHVLLSIGVVPGALAAFWFAGRGSFERHKRVTRLLLPAWLYVSVTGVLIFILLRIWGAPAAG